MTYKMWDVKLTVSITKNGTKKTYERSTGYDPTGPSGTFGGMVCFINETKKIWGYAMKSKAKGFWYELEICEYVFDGDQCIDCDRWVSRYEPDDTDGIYLVADERYTRPERDMYITKDTLADITFTLN